MRRFGNPDSCQSLVPALHVSLTDLIMLGASILQANHTFVEDVWNTILDAIERHEFDLINSTALTNDFGVRGKKFTDLAGLERIFRLGS